MTKLYIATPLYGGKACVSYTTSLLKTAEALRERGVPVQIDLIGNESLIQRARNIMSDRFLKSDCTHLFFIDGDIGFDPDQVLRLISADKPIVAGVYPKKYLNFDKIQQKMDGSLVTSESLESVGLDYNLNIKYNATNTISDGFIESLDAATGFLMISREAFLKVWEKHPELEAVNDMLPIGTESTKHTYRAVFECMICPETKRYLSEDFAFIRRAQMCGIRVFCDLLSKLTHTGSFVVKTNQLKTM